MAQEEVADKVAHIESDAKFQEFLKNNKGKFVFIDFFATWCGPCVRIAPYVKKMAAEDKYKDIAFAKVDVDQCDETSQAYKIQAMPTFILLDKEHKEKKMGRGGSEAVVNEVLAAAAGDDKKDAKAKEEDKVAHINSDADFKKLLKDNEGKYIFIDFFATWCGPCVRIAPYVKKMAEEAKYKDIAFAKVDVDQCDETSKEYKIQAMPTFILLGKDHKELKSGRGGSEAVVNEVLGAAK